MDVQTKQQILLLLLLDLLVILLAAKISPLTKPGCPGHCGSLNIPYPFGTKEGCYLDATFFINCTQTSNPTTPTPFLRRSNFTVLSISLEEGEMRISNTVARYCYNEDPTYSRLNLTHFYVSSSRNKFTVVGCSTIGVIENNQEGKNYITGCLSICNKLDDIVANESCSGTAGCCQTPIPKGISSFRSGFGRLDSTPTPNFNPCGYAFVVDEEAYSFSSKDLINFPNQTVPVVLDWAVGNQTCREAQNNLISYACKSDHSECYNSINGGGYRCNCSSGFRGNPYLLHGCRDINECDESNSCVEICHNFPGGYNCSCPKDQEGDGTINGTGCHLKVSSNSMRGHLLIIGLVASLFLLILLLVSFYVYWELNQRKLAKLRQKYFHQNGGNLLQQQIAEHQGSAETPKIFTAKELNKATNNYDDGRVLGQGGNGTVYKGVLPDNRVVAIKKSKISDQSQIEQFINEVIVLSQINHRNVVKLLGCCLETEVPLLVYEYINNGTLSDHLHDEIKAPKLSWTMRLKIARETAGVLAYLHSATSTPIIHRDVKATNILLDDNLIARVSDFGSSKLVPLDKSQLTTLVQGTLGYLDPEYFLTSQLTEKSDVYSFGVVLTELLTSMKALSFDRPENDRNLSMYFVSSMKEGTLLRIVDKSIINEASAEQIMEVANIAKRCLKLSGKERPTMKEVAMELEGLRFMENHPWGGTDIPSKETEPLIQARAPPHIVDIEDGGGSSHGSSVSAFDSIKKRNLGSLGDGR